MIAAVIMVGHPGSTDQEKLVSGAQQANVYDLIALLRRHEVAPIVIAAPDTSKLGVVPAPDLNLSDDPTHTSFQFGNRLADLIAQLITRGDVSAIWYVGAGSVPLIDDAVMAQIAAWENRLESNARCALTNNLHSSDWLLLRTDQDIKRLLRIIRQTTRDNSLAWLLNAEFGNGQVEILSGVRPVYGFDIDTPTDLAILGAYSATPPALKNYLDRSAAALQRIRLNDAVKVMKREGSTIALIGRVAPAAWQAFNQVAHSWTRVIAEERGMVGSGRVEAGLVRSVLAPWIAARGVEDFFGDLSGMADAVLIDSRVLFAALHLDLSAADRFASDLMWPDMIADPWLRGFTEAAAQCPVPVLLGGHTLVAGGLYAITEIVARDATPG